jgi:pimeloyl-ACP methyl ester carboxylesterase
MAGGFAVPKEPATDKFARRFHEAGFSVLAFDYRRLGESGGEPRLAMPIGDQVADWQAAITCAATLPGVDHDKIGIWAFSASGGFALEVAARDPRVAAAVLQTPVVDGRAALAAAGKYQTRSAMLRFTATALLDALGWLVGRPPRLVPLVGEPGTVAMLTTPDAVEDSYPALDPDGAHTAWTRTVASRSALRLTLYRPVRFASQVAGPVLVVVCDEDKSAVPAPALRAARLAPRSELLELSGRHYAPFLGEHERAVEAELSFLRRHLLGGSGGDQAAVVATATAKTDRG